MPGMCAPGDLGRIASFLDLAPDAVLPMFRASPGAKVARIADGRLQTWRILTIVPGTDDTGQCVFLHDSPGCPVRM